MHTDTQNQTAIRTNTEMHTSTEIQGCDNRSRCAGMELVGPKKRMFVGIVVEMFWSVGVMILGGMAYFVRDWDKLQMIMSFPILLLFSYWW